jgi:leucine-zipper-like transcriptional regulator 1
MLSPRQGLIISVIVIAIIVSLMFLLLSQEKLMGKPTTTSSVEAVSGEGGHVTPYLINSSGTQARQDTGNSSVNTVSRERPKETHSGNVSSLANPWIVATKSAEFPARMFHTSVVYGNRMWVIGGVGDQYHPLNDVWYSTNGINWTQATASAEFLPRDSATSVVYDNKMWIIGGRTYGKNRSQMSLNDVWYSTNGVNWTEATASAEFSPREEAVSVIFDNKMWVIGGIRIDIIPYNYTELHDIWTSTDGVHWTEVNASPALPSRHYATSLVYDDKIWVIGGFNYLNIPVNDVWYSTDGNHWSVANNSAAFIKRIGTSSVVYNNKMWLLGGDGTTGGEDDYRLCNDVWVSTNGVNWTLVNGGINENGETSSGFTPRAYHTSAVYDNKIWVIGGDIDNRIVNRSIQVTNDTWYLDTTKSEK